MVSKEKVLLIAEKHGSKISMIIAGIIVSLVFVLGRASVNIPPKSVICESEIKTIDSQYKVIEKLQLKLKKDLENQRDNLTKTCDKKVVDEIGKFKDSSNSLDCRVCAVLKSQCESKGNPICN